MQVVAHCVGYSADGEVVCGCIYNLGCHHEPLLMCVHSNYDSAIAPCIIVPCLVSQSRCVFCRILSLCEQVNALIPARVPVGHQVIVTMLYILCDQAWMPVLLSI